MGQRSRISTCVVKSAYQGTPTRAKRTISYVRPVFFCWSGCLGGIASGRKTAGLFAHQSLQGLHLRRYTHVLSPNGKVLG